MAFLFRQGDAYDQNKMDIDSTKSIYEQYVFPRCAQRRTAGSMRSGVRTESLWQARAASERVADPRQSGQERHRRGRSRAPLLELVSTQQRAQMLLDDNFREPKSSACFN